MLRSPIPFAYAAVMVWASVAASIFDFFLPRECPACRTGFEGKSVFCTECEKEMSGVEAGARCNRCSMPAAYHGAPCAQCLGRGLPPFKTIVSLGVLKDPLKTAIHQAKYRHNWVLAERLADRLINRTDVKSVLDDTDVVVPVPLHCRRQWQRGYNQAEVIARQLLDNVRNHPALVSPIIRVLATDTQTHLHSKELRAKNLKDAFVLVNASAVAGKRVVLVDDVLTTGSTLRALARTLSPAKPARISAIVLAVADPKGRHFEII